MSRVAVLEHDVSQLRQQLSTRTTTEVLLAVYKDQFQWAVDHRNAISQRMAILVTFLGITVGLLGVVLTAGDRPSFQQHWAIFLQIGMGLLVFVAIPLLVLLFRSMRTGVGRYFTGLDDSSVESLSRDLLLRHRILARENIRWTRRVRTMFNVVVYMVLIGVLFIAISMWFTVSLN